ncbi:conjugative transposon TraN protein [Dysgonomonas hofstadii]|uniref:Conjugative transposon TraN protein n=1 Tax=Dysgonomonas hofstadii TaxID=637886 RepID=A0A840CHF2_9BACT|nr:conjugative transposon protein TraN [Dysgonomonas hofstadii]MBB4035437.1 conjugative transposon TraN protein [Dysgonomonas hofstadii]
MKQFIVLISLLISFSAVYAQQETEQSDNRPVIGRLQEQPSEGDLYQGLTRKIMFDRMIPPYGVEVTFDKTTTLIFPSSIKDVDLGSSNIVAARAQSSDNVLRVKAAIRGFEKETNMSVITEEGSFYTFNIRYADEPVKLNIEMKDFMHDGEAVNHPNNSMEIYLKDLGSESPKVVHLIMRSIYHGDKRIIKHIGSKRFGLQYLLKGIYTHNNLLYLHTQIKNESNVTFDIDFIRIKIVDKKLTKRTAIQEMIIIPLRAFNYVTEIPGNSTRQTVFTIEKITIPDNKKLIVELYEKQGGRNQSFTIENADLVRAEKINELKVK